MQRGMRTHALVTKVPVDPGDHARAGAGQGGSLGGHMQNGRAVGIVDRIDDRNRRAVLEHERPAIPALSSALRIKDRAIERDAARLGRHDHRFRLGAIRVIAKQRLRHFANTTGALPRASSQSGTGRLFERRKAGLKSFEA